jgi:hypothetical protein
MRHTSPRNLDGPANVVTCGPQRTPHHHAGQLGARNAGGRGRSCSQVEGGRPQLRNQAGLSAMVQRLRAEGGGASAWRRGRRGRPAASQSQCQKHAGPDRRGGPTASRCQKRVGPAGELRPATGWSRCRNGQGPADECDPQRPGDRVGARGRTTTAAEGRPPFVESRLRGPARVGQRWPSGRWRQRSSRRSRKPPLLRPP